MKTIAITIDTASLQDLDQLSKAEGRNRSEVVREAVSEYLADWRRMQDEEKERIIFRRLRKKLGRQVDAMLREQAEP
jgi:metal-responsive CopG/Arc/MetJ family transcriptional regulator